MSLRRITEVGAIDMTPRRLQELLKPVIEASHEKGSRREIMRHLRDCLSEPRGKKWQRIYGGLVLMEKLAQHGSHVLLVETAHGHHFHLLQKLSLIEQFDAAARECCDRRAQHSIRRKASELRESIVPCLQKASAEELPESAYLCLKSAPSACSLGSMSSTTASSPTSMRSVNSFSGLVELGASLTDDLGGIASGMAQPHGAGCPSPQEPQPTARVETAASTLERELNSFTNSEIGEPAPKLLPSIIDASYDTTGRGVIVAHLESCLVEPAAHCWRSVYRGLLIAEGLMEHGSLLVFTESIPGIAPDIPKHIWFLEQFELRTDWRAANLVRRKAIELREKMVPLLLCSGGRESGLGAPERIDDAFSTLATWAESTEPATPLGSPPGEPPTSGASPGAFGGAAGGISGCTSGRPVGGGTPAAGALDDGAVADVFFTPLQTPAMGLAKVSASVLISL